MVPSSAGAVVMVAFPFSDLSQTKLRPAVVLAGSGRGDWVLCQITSNAYADRGAVLLESQDFAVGSLRLTSYARPGKLFTANVSLIASEVGTLTPSAFERVLKAVVGLLQPNNQKVEEGSRGATIHRVESDDQIQNILRGLEQHSALQSLADIVPAVAELSHDWHDTLHFTARETSTGLQVVIKVGVTEAEMYWTEHLSSADAVLFPKVFAVDHLPARAGRKPIGFIVSERIPYTLIGPAWEGRQSDMLLDAVTAFYQAARGVARQHIPPLPIEEVQQWLAEGDSKHPPGDWRVVLDHAEEDYAWLQQSCPPEVCHGDLHVGNALSRTPPPNGTVLLIDLNPVLQPWVFDAAWVEVCAWSDHRRRGTGYTIRQLAERRSSLGLPALSADVQEKAGRIALAWLAMRLWDPDHLEFMPGFKEATEAYINLGATVPRLTAP